MIKRTVAESHSHPTADDIYRMLRPSLPNLSLGTVYRNLNLLTKNGDIVRIFLPSGNDRFDGRKKSHYHALCGKCGRIFDFELPLLSALDDIVEASTGIQIRKRDYIVEGICEACRQEGAEK